MAGMLAANFPAPTIELEEGDEFYLTLTNVGMMMRPDLFDPHTVHFHGFPQAAPIFDGVPEASHRHQHGLDASPTTTRSSSPGTYMYHCHVEATEHMQMGMLGNLYVRPAQDGTPYGRCSEPARTTRTVRLQRRRRLDRLRRRVSRSRSARSTATSTSQHDASSRCRSP